MNKSQAFLLRHFSDRNLETITGLSRNTIRQFRVGERVLNVKQSGALRNGYAKIQYRRMRETGLNRDDALKNRYDSPERVRGMLKTSSEIAEIIARNVIDKMKDRNADRVAEGKTPLKVPDIKKKIKAIMEGMAKSQVPEEERWEWVEKYAVKK